MAALQSDLQLEKKTGGSFNDGVRKISGKLQKLLKCLGTVLYKTSRARINRLSKGLIAPLPAEDFLLYHREASHEM